MPAIAWWPGRIPPGKSTDQTAISIDLMPTMLDLAGASVPKGHKLDGVSLATVLFEQKPLTARPLFWGHVSGSGGKSFAMRDGPWKLVSLKKDRPQLFHLGRDLKESSDLASEEPDRTKQMVAALEAWKKEVARVPASK